MKIVDTRFAMVRIASLAVMLSVSRDAAAQPTLLDPTVTQASGGVYHTCAVTASGGVKCWGYNFFGQLGDGTQTQRTSPIDVPGLSGIASVVAGNSHTCALTVGGGVKCWGANTFGAVGDGTTVNRLAPVNVTGLSSGVVSISAGVYHTCALTTAGGVKCWGGNGNGQLGDGTTVDHTTPVDVAGLSSGVASISVGFLHTCALTTGGGLKCWGNNSSGGLGDGSITQRTTPTDVSGLTTGVAALAAGGYHSCALTVGAGLKCWGDNTYGQIGDGTTVQRTTAVNVSGLSSGVAGLATIRDHTCALTNGGAVKCWGYNLYGELGDGTTTQRNTPVDVVGLSSGVSRVITGREHTCALSAFGGLQCWGSNVFGAVGDGTTTDRSTPVPVAGLAAGVIRISANLAHTCALTPAGGVKCWGDNFSGQLGDGTTISRTTPVDVVGLTSGVAALAAGYRHTCAVTDTGGAKCWGYNWAGQLGDGTTTDQPTPVDVVGLTSGVTAIAAGLDHTCALTTTQGVKCWGAGSRGQLGNSGTTGQLTPVDVTGLTSGVAAISAGGGPVSGGGFTCALTTGGGIMCWGNNNSGQLGDGTSGTIRTAPVNVSGLSSGAASVSVGPYHTCAVTTGGGAKCWGNNVYGQLGDGTTITRFAPVDVSGLTSGVAKIAVPGTTIAGASSFWHSGAHTCAVVLGGGVKCWGLNRQGQLGDGTTTDRLTPVNVSALTSGASDISLGEVRTCALTSGSGLKCWGAGIFGDGAPIEQTGIVDVLGLTSGVASLSTGYYESCVVTTGGGAKCWGYNEFGGLGDGTITDRSSAVDVTGLTSGMARISAGEFANTCAVTSGGGAKCWGLNQAGGLGDGTTTTRLTPVDVSGLTSGVARIDASNDFACAVTTGGGAKCWGRNSSGQLGDGTTTQRLTAVDVSGLTSGVANVSAGRTHACVLTTGGGVKCWGSNANGELGDGTTTPRLVAGDVLGLTGGVASVSSGGSHTCALTTAGGVKCWGFNGSGQLGDGTFIAQRLTATDVSGLTSGVAAISAGYSHTCAVTTAGVVKCWGSNYTRQLGDGTTTDRSAPVDVSGLPAGMTSVAAASNHTCALTGGGGVKCWGSYGSLGDGAVLHRTTPVAIRAGQSLTFTPPAALTVGSSASLSGTASSGLIVSFDTWTPGSCIVAGTTVTPTATALCGIRASQAGNGTSVPASQQLRLVAVAAAVAPTVTAPTSVGVTGTGATLGGNVTTDGGSAITSRGVAYSVTATNPNPQVGGPGVSTSIVGGTTGLFTTGVTGLAAATTYSFKAFATNAGGTAYTSAASFTTLALPTATTGAATAVTVTSATLNGVVNPNGITTTALFSYGVTTGYGSQVAATPSPGSGSASVGLSAAVSGLSCSTTYHYRLVATSSAGSTNGADGTFTTPACQGLSIDDPTVAEGGAGGSILAFTISLPQPVTTHVTVTYATSNGTATSGSDYTAASGVFTIPAGSTSKRITIRVQGDVDVESDETVMMTLSNATGATIAKSVGVGTISNDDPANPATLVTQYRLYHDGTKEHLYTTDLNEYNVLGGNGWIQEGVAYKMLTNGIYNGAAATVPLFRAYHPGILQHHWTTDSNEALTLSNTPSWFYEAAIGYLLPTQLAGTIPLYRMALASPPIHLWTTDKNEYDTLVTRGWIGEGIIGYVVP